MIRFGVQELEPPGGGNSGAQLCPILPLSVQDFAAAAAVVQPPPGAPEDTIFSGDIIRSVQEALRAKGATDENGIECPLSGHYTNLTRAVLANWAKQQRINTTLSKYGPPNVTTCALYRALGITPAGLWVVTNVTPQAERIWSLFKAGQIKLDCSDEAKIGIGVPRILVIGGITVAVIWLYTTLNKR